MCLYVSCIMGMQIWADGLLQRHKSLPAMGIVKLATAHPALAHLDLSNSQDACQPPSGPPPHVSIGDDLCS